MGVWCGCVGVVMFGRWCSGFGGWWGIGLGVGVGGGYNIVTEIADVMFTCVLFFYLSVKKYFGPKLIITRIFL